MRTATPSLAMESWPSIARFGGYVDAGLATGRLFAYDTGRGDGEKSGAAAPRGGASRPTMLLIHGLGDEADSWRKLIPLLEGSARVIAPDLPGFGRSESRRRVGVSACVAAILGLLDASGVDRAILVGSSLGGVIAQIVAFRAPGRCSALALVDGSLPGLEAPRGAWRGAVPLLGERGYRSLRGRPEAAYRSLAPYYADLEALPAEERDFLRKRVIQRVESDSQARAYFSLFRSLALWTATRSGFFAQGLRAFEGPVLAAWGELDRIAYPGSADAPASLAPRGRKAIIAGAGHLPQQERAEELAALLLETAAEA